MGLIIPRRHTNLIAPTLKLRNPKKVRSSAVHSSCVQCVNCIQPIQDRKGESDKAVTSSVIQTNKERKFGFGLRPFTESMI